MHITKSQKCGVCVFLLFKYFLDNAFLTVFVQNLISKFVKVLPQNLNNREHASVQQPVRTLCAKFKVYHLKSLSVHTEIVYQHNSCTHENCKVPLTAFSDQTTIFEIYFSNLHFFLRCR